VGVKHVSSKFDWADAEGADHLVLILSCYPTNPCRDWIGKKRATARFKVHVVDGKHLKQVLLKFPQPLERYFASPIQRVLRNSIVDWALCALLPEVGRVSYVLCNSDLSRLDSLERACLLASSAASRSGIGSKVDGQNEQFAEKLCALAHEAEHDRNRSDLVAGIAEIFNRGRAELLEERHGIMGGDIPQIQTSSVRYDLVAKERYVEGFLTSFRVSDGFWIEAIIARERSSGDWVAEARLADTAHRDTRFRVGPCEPPAGEMPFRGLFSSQVELTGGSEGSG